MARSCIAAYTETMRALDVLALAFFSAGSLHYLGKPGFTMQVPLPARYDPMRHVGDDFLTARDIARSSGRRILLQVGSERCVWSHRMDAFFDSQSSLARYRDERLVVLKVAIDHGSMGEALMPWLPPVPGTPHFFVLDTEGRVRMSKDTEQLEVGDSYDRGKMFGFFTEAAVATDPQFTDPAGDGAPAPAG